MWPILATTATANSITKRNATLTRNNMDRLIFTFFNHYFIRRSQTLFQAKRPDLTRHLRLFAAEHEIRFQRRVIRAQIFHFHLDGVDLANGLLGIMRISDIDQSKREHKQDLGKVMHRKTFLKIRFKLQPLFDGRKNTESTRKRAGL